jgi:uncharacterized membrane-anchored protein YhcB (DUF1043 family)
MNPMILIGAGALILLIGAGLGYWLGSFGRRKASAEAEEVRAELDDYRRQVTEHFSTTAAHFEAIGAEYRKLYEHMATGAGELCEAGQYGRAVIFEPVEKLAEGVVIDEAEPPRDYDIEEPDTPGEELPELVPSDSATPDIDEPTDVELAVTEATEELLTDHDLLPDAETEKTIH